MILMIRANSRPEGTPANRPFPGGAGLLRRQAENGALCCLGDPGDPELFSVIGAAQQGNEC
jgi:hypothetical protein